MASSKENQYVATGKNANALFTLKLHRGDGMLLLAMNWKSGKPPKDFVGFAIEYKEPKGKKFYPLKNRVSFPDKDGNPVKGSLPTTEAPIQKFRWVHFPRIAELNGSFTYRVKPVFMDAAHKLTYGKPQQAQITLKRDTYPGQLNVSFTRGFVSSQAFVDKYTDGGGIKTLLPPKSDKGLDFKPTHPKAKEALAWMGFEARSALLELLDKAIKDKTAEVKVACFDLNEPELVNRFIKLGRRLQIIIDDSKDHKKKGAAENKAAQLLEKAGATVKRQHMNQLQHNKTIIVNGSKVKCAVGGSTNFSWRGLYVQANNAIIVSGAKAIQPFLDAFDAYMQYDSVTGYGKTSSAEWNDLHLKDIDAQVTFSPHASGNARLEEIALDMKNNTHSSLFFSLAFLYQTQGAVRTAVKKLSSNSKIFVAGISDKKVGGIDVKLSSGNVEPVFPSELSSKLPEPFKSEPTGGGGTRMHHKFVVIDFDKPEARVYMGSYNFSGTADLKNGENLFVIRNRKIATSYMVEAVRLFDHYEFRIAQKQAKKTRKALMLAIPPRKRGEKTWWEKYYTDKRRIKDRQLFS